MKRKLWLQRVFGVSAARMTIRRHVPWPVRLATIALAIGIGAVGAIWAWQYLFGNVSASQEAQRVEIARLQTELEAQSAERLRLDAIVNSAESQIKVERTAAERLAGQIKSLEEENARLKSDVSYFESLLPATEGADAGISIRRFEVKSEPTPAQFRYKALILQGGRQEKEFAGSIQLVFSTVVGARTVNWVWPDQSSAEARDRSKLVFSRYRRLEGVVDLPPGSVVRTVQLRVLERGAVKAQQLTSL